MIIPRFIHSLYRFRNYVIKEFMQKIYPVYKDNPRTDILINNTDFGVGD